MNYKVLIAALLAASVVHADGRFHPPPQKWMVAGAGGQGDTQCDVGVDARMLDSGQRNLSIACRAPVFSAMRQPILAAPLWGKRIRFSAWIKTEGVDPADMGGKGGAGLLINYEDSDSPISELMNDRRLTGSTEWEYRELVVDVARGGQFLSVGLWLRGRGQVWVRDLNFEEVSSSVPVVRDEGPVDLLAPSALGPIPRGWSAMNGGGPLTLPGACGIGVDSRIAGNDQPHFTILCANAEVPSFGGLYKSFEFARYLGKRIRVSGWLKAADIADMRSATGSNVEGGGGLWLSVGSPAKGIRMDRMVERAIKGSTSWEYRDFVVDIPPDNSRLMVGFWAQGKGQLWVRDLTIEEVPETVPVNFFWDDPQRPTGPDLSLE